MIMPQEFIVEFSHVHGQTLREFNVENVTLSPTTLHDVCTRFSRLESLSCSLPWQTDIVRRMQL